MNALAVANSTIKAEVQATIEEHGGAFVRLAHDIHAHPELAFTETYAAGRLTEFLADEGFAVEGGVGGLPTAFTASVGDGPLHIAFCAEYDALDDGIGHGCGHNLIAGAAVAAAVGLRDHVGEVGLRVSVIGTPGEELIGLKQPTPGQLAQGKIRLLEAGVFDDVDAVLMVHPGPTPYSEFIPSVAGLRIRAHFSKSATGSGIGPAQAKALDQSVRRVLASAHRPPYFCRIEPEDSETGASVDLFVAAPSLAELVSVRDPLRACLRAAAAAAAVGVDITEFVPDAELRNDPLLLVAFRRNAEALGRVRERDPNIQKELRHIRNEVVKETLRHPRNLPRMLAMASHPPVGLFLDQAPVDVQYGTDLGDVSQVIPAIHPMIGIGGTAPNNTKAFTPQADTDEAYRAMLDGGTALAWTALDAATDRAMRDYLEARASKRLAAGPTNSGPRSQESG